MMNYQQEDDTKLFFEKWILENGSSLLKYIYTLVKHKELAEDLYQESLISAYLGLPAFEARANLKSWVYKIAKNKCRDFWRKEKSARKFLEEKAYLSLEESDLPKPEECVLHKCEQAEMVETLYELPKMYRDPIILFYYHDKSLLEISSSKNLPISTVKTRMKRAKDQLKPKVKSLVAL